MSKKPIVSMRVCLLYICSTKQESAQTTTLYSMRGNKLSFNPDNYEGRDYYGD